MNDQELLEELLRRAADLVPVLEERAPRAEELRHVPPESVDDLIDSGLMRVVSPSRFGGSGLDIDAAFAVAAELGRGCGSTAWCYAMWTTHSWWIGHFPEEGQQEYFATGPDTVCSSALNPIGARAERVDGGYRVSGRWAFSSGCDAASWVVVACQVESAGRLWMILPADECTILDTWFTLGLRGSGSKGVVVEDVFVPDHRVTQPDRAGEFDRTGSESDPRASYRAPLKVFVEWALAAPVIGMAQGAVEEFTSRSRARVGGPPGRGADDSSRQLRLALAAAEVDAARVVHGAEVREILDRCGRGATLSAADRARYARDAAFAVSMCRQAVDRLYAAGGAGALMDGDPLQRSFRDVNAAAHHASLDWDSAALRFGREILAPTSGGVADDT